MIRQQERQFHLHPRNGIFYVQFINPETKQRLSALSTGKSTRDEALLIVYDWLAKGIPKKQPKTALSPSARLVSDVLSTAQILAGLKNAALTSQDVLKIEKILQDQGLVSLIIRQNTLGDELFEDFITRFWDYKRSPYVQEKHSHKLRIGQTHTKLSLERAYLYWIPFFKGKTLGPGRTASGFKENAYSFALRGILCG
ncbi:hypothetical protein TREPR_2061 [Treponema primitia ZAS-2]|uniref:Uncharacterized protein n=1 Tax=Treponema primitia (strain ATCC BAA-887 / DSM 12427 / ZAS-2) TaxID=545694 RepID=F5YJS6_TREPZ|nr:hypothetical protein [Treponema primitia]AEF85502.1 hypothetical protein TREPR_2061 [Treponema primitia ZAS-2]